MSSCTRCGLEQPTAELIVCPRCLLSEDEPQLPEAPPGLLIEAEIGRGGMGRVFRARQIRLDRDVAVKFLPDDGTSDPSSEARFEREARTLARLSHPNIVLIHDYGVLGSGQRYLVMEYVRGGTLRERLPLPEPEALRVCLEVSQALLYAHKAGIVHRDIKPDNVLFDADGRAKLADFGIARLLDADASDTLTHPLHVLGTPGFVAPEVVSGARPHPRMDVFAVGILLKVMLLGRLDAPSLTGISAKLAELIELASAPDPARRLESASDLIVRLEELLGKAPPALIEAQQRANALPPDEKSWQRAVALTLAGATALSLHALLVSVTPRALLTSELTDFLVFGATHLPDGRVLTQARFETMPTLLAAGGWVVGFFAYGLLRRHWRKEQLELAEPALKLEGTRALMLMALGLNALWVLRMVLEASGSAWFTIYVPVVGGVLELVMLYLFWSAVLEALRVKRPLRREPLLWLGLGLSLLPPTTAFFSMLAGSAN